LCRTSGDIIRVRCHKSPPKPQKPTTATHATTRYKYVHVSKAERQTPVSKAERQTPCKLKSGTNPIKSGTDPTDEPRANSKAEQIQSTRSFRSFRSFHCHSGHSTVIRGELVMMLISKQTSYKNTHAKANKQSSNLREKPQTHKPTATQELKSGTEQATKASVPVHPRKANKQSIRVHIKPTNKAAISIQTNQKDQQFTFIYHGGRSQTKKRRLQLYLG
jgi:hypothetical protein